MCLSSPVPRRAKRSPAADAGRRCRRRLPLSRRTGGSGGHFALGIKAPRRPFCPLSAGGKWTPFSAPAGAEAFDRLGRLLSSARSYTRPTTPQSNPSGLPAPLTQGSQALRGTKASSEKKPSPAGDEGRETALPCSPSAVFPLAPGAKRGYNQAIFYDMEGIL